MKKPEIINGKLVNRKPNTECDLCKNPIYRRPTELERNAGKFCSRACRNKVHTEQCYGKNPKKALKMEKNPAWKGGVTYKRPKGNYTGVKYVRCPKEFLGMARKDGYIMEHRLVMAQSMGRLLTRTEVVHHEDHNPSNNKIENLVLFATNGEHKRYEGQQARLKAGEQH